ncbi:DedA family protein [Streptomyces sp. SID5614]|uniref:DedA family protein n=1 Tax=Streptomyces sp. SID5614 TaxID=2690306 RepID=UPI00136AF4B5|nr:DedA family protein [Streptomyces sp. SID5614]MZG06585.1 DedA family protein [Streptomyces sp. SID5614]
MGAVGSRPLLYEGEGTGMFSPEAMFAVVPVWLTLVFLFLLPAVEPAVPVVGMLFPSQTALVASGVLVHHGVLPVAGVFALAVAGALAGNVLGYGVGRRWGDRLEGALPGRLTGSRSYRLALATVGARHGRAVLLGRFNGGLRTLVPALCGSVQVPWRPYLGWSLLAALLWAPCCVGIGLLAGSSWEKWGGSGVLACASVVLLLTTSVPLLLTARGEHTRAARASCAEEGPVQGSSGGHAAAGDVRVTAARRGSAPAPLPAGPGRSGPRGTAGARTTL